MFKRKIASAIAFAAIPPVVEPGYTASEISPLTNDPSPSAEKLSGDLQEIKMTLEQRIDDLKYAVETILSHFPKIVVK